MPHPSPGPLAAESRPLAPVTSSAGRGFGATFAMLLLLLAVAFAGVAGVMWVINERPDLLGGGGMENVASTATVEATQPPAPTPTSPPNGPVVIEPIEEEPSPTPTSLPTLDPTPTPLPTPDLPPTPTLALPTIAVIEPLPTQPADGEELPQIIEPIQDSTVVIEPED
jgi:hypothetical protein